jgi:hypothetical protein
MMYTRIFLPILICANFIAHHTLVKSGERPNKFTEKIFLQGEQAIILGICGIAASMLVAHFTSKKDTEESDKLLPLQLEALRTERIKAEAAFLNARANFLQTNNAVLELFRGEVNRYCDDNSPFKNDGDCTRINNAYFNHLETMNNHTIIIQ